MAGWIGMTEGRKMPLAITRIYFENPLKVHRVQDKLCSYVASLGAVSAMSLRLLRDQDTRNSVSLLIRGKQTVIELISNTSSMSRKYLLCRVGNFLSSQRRRVFPVLLASRVQPGSVPLTRKRTQAIPPRNSLRFRRLLVAGGNFD